MTLGVTKNELYQEVILDQITEKKQIYFARTYRHLRMNRLETILFLVLLVVPALIVLLFFYDELAFAMSNFAGYAFKAAGLSEVQMASSTFIPGLGPSYYLKIPNVQPGYGLILGNLAAALFLVWLFSTGLRKGKPVSVYLSIVFLIHIMTCVFFLLGRDLFPYTASDYADLYVKQEIGIWITFLVLIGLVMGILGRGGILRRMLTVVCLMAYSFLFGAARYIVFLWVLSKFSVLYMPLMFFALGPFFDFLYFVAIYAVCTNSMIRMYDSKRKGDWTWA